MGNQKTTFDHLINQYHIAVALLSVLHTFVLASSSWTCEEDISEVPYFVLNGCQFGCAVLCGIVLVCGSAIIRRTSRSPQGFGASLAVAHPILAGIKLFTRCSQQSYPCSWTYYREDQAILVLVYIGTYQWLIRIFSHFTHIKYDCGYTLCSKQTEFKWLVQDLMY